MKVAGPPPVRPAAGGALVARLDQVRARIRLLRTLAGLGRLLTGTSLALVLLYAADRWLELPLAVRAALGLLVAAAAGREVWRHVARPLFRGPDRADAARLIERVLPESEGRLISALQLGAGEPGSLGAAVQAQAEELCRGRDLRALLFARPSLRLAARGASCAGALLLLVATTAPHVDVFVRRWTLREVPWPRDTRLSMSIAERGPAHLTLPDGTLLAARGGLVEAVASVAGKDPGRVEFVAAGPRGERAVMMGVLPERGWQGQLVIERDDRELFVRGGDDEGGPSRRALQVIEPPRLEAPEFTLRPPAYLGQPARVTGPEGLAVDEGTAIGVRGVVQGEVQAAELRLAVAGSALPLAQQPVDGGVQLTGELLADASDTLSFVLTGPYGLATPDPSHHPLLVRKDRAPVLRVFHPARSDLKVTARAVVPFGVVAEDDHGVVAVELLLGDAPPLALAADPARPESHRLVLDLATTPSAGSRAYRLLARDGRQLPGRGPQEAAIEGRRLDVVDEGELLRLLADRQLRLKESFRALRDRQQAALDEVALLAADPPPADAPELVAAVVAQNQVTTRLTREAQELCSVLDESIWNRLDPGPGAAAVLEWRMRDWSSAPVSDAFLPAAWAALADEYAAGRFGRLDLLGRLLDMASLALRLQQTDSPDAHARLAQARTAPDAGTLAAALDAQRRVLAGLEQLLGRMDEWEDYQEVLLVVKTLIDEQSAVRARAQAALSGGRTSQ